MNKATDLTWSITSKNDKIAFGLKGELTRNTLLPLWRQRSSLFARIREGEQDVYCDLSALSGLDSAGFALFCDILAECRSRLAPQYKLQLENIPSQLLTLAELYDLKDWLQAFIKEGHI
ncbi:phospholipid transport system transporter-binding protein [Mesocricetibacter intestinalis]|uniref:Phospholipid transport system transporter-binding protein n=1 Tax=Mesocricetibacter intestinalis TaxID=1521930 RepID=A0A4R6V8U0_9PAST|nr:STAS domain-containing protein [Mesocricetibacter intestinalis]TDQ57910.1 phospholipid transport system transporter-binding protein [Mesocricetibacter intestinalis]